MDGLVVDGEREERRVSWIPGAEGAPVVWGVVVVGCEGVGTRRMD